jgi:hypothetical protein
MTTHPIVPTVLGLRAEKAARRDVDALTSLLESLPDEAWRGSSGPRPAPLELVAHLAAGARRLGEAWIDRVDPAETTGALQHPVHDPGTEAGLAVSAPGEALEAYVQATGTLLAALGTCRSDDWAWPVWSPLGGTEPLAGAVRRWVAHHRVHHLDIAEAAGRSVTDDPDLQMLVSEFVLDAVARRGGPAVTPPLHVEVIVDPPGSGTWTLVVDEPQSVAELPSLWQEIMSRQDERDLHRLERGTTGAARLVVRTNGETLWRAAFDRGASWDDVELHGDDDTRALFRRMTASLTSGEQGVSRIQT